jgi:hypothetical protein
MLKITIRATLAVVAVATAIIVTNKYYAQAVECLARLEKLAHAAIPTALALALLYHVLKNIKDKKD